ncbi:hypothetical protein D3C85_1195900 [compost metagenome]
MHQLLGKLPDTEDLVAQCRVNLLDHIVQADRVGKQLVVLFGIQQDRQHANLVDQPGQCCLVRLELSEAQAQFITDAGHIQAFRPDFAHFLFNDIGAGVEDLLDHQADRQVAAVVDTQAGDGRVQVSDLGGGAQQRAVDHLDQAR